MDELAKYKTKYENLSNDQLINVIATLDFELTQLKAMMFGSKRERRLHISEGQGRLFDEAEDIIESESESIDEQDTTEVKPHKRKKGGRKPISDKIPRIRKEIDLNQEDKVCKIHNVALEKIGEKINEKLEMIPAKLQVIQEVRPTYKCPCCVDNGDSGFKTPEKEAEPIQKSFATPSLLASILTYKFADGLPFYRQQRIFNRLGIELSRATMARWAIQMVDLFTPIVNLLLEELKDSNVLHCDETTVQVLNEPKKRPQSKSYMWCLARQTKNPIIFFQYHPYRNANCAKILLDGFSGHLICDGYKVYENLAEKLGFTISACMSHIRRKFYNAEKAAKKSGVKPKKIIASQALYYIRQLYKIEKQIKELPPDKGLEIRIEKSKPIFDGFQEWLETQVEFTLPSSPTGKAISYAMGQWPKMDAFLKNADIAIDNNFLESHLRPFVVGRKAWLFSKSQKGADASAAIYSLVETAKANGIEPFDYLNIIIKELPKATCLEDFQNLLPYNIASHYKLNKFSKAL